MSEFICRRDIEDRQYMEQLNLSQNIILNSGKLSSELSEEVSYKKEVSKLNKQLLIFVFIIKQLIL